MCVHKQSFVNLNFTIIISNNKCFSVSLLFMNKKHVVDAHYNCLQENRQLQEFFNGIINYMV